MINEKISGIYMILNIANNKKYIGSTINIKIRFNKHINQLNKNNHDNKYLQHSWNKHGQNNFLFLIIEEININNLCKSDIKKILLDKEQYYLDFYKSYVRNLGYNICEKAYNSYGFRHSETTKNKLSKMKKGTTMSEETKDKISNTLMGRIISEEQKEILRKFNTGKKMSEESKKKMSKFHKGKTISEEQKQLSSIQNRGSNNSNSKLTEKEVIEIKTIFKNKSDTMINISKKYNISMTQLKRIKSGKSWSHIKID